MVLWVGGGRILILIGFGDMCCIPGFLSSFRHVPLSMTVYSPVFGNHAPIKRPLDFSGGKSVGCVVSCLHQMVG